MNKKLLVIPLLALGLIAGCGASSTGGTPTPAASQSQPAPQPTRSYSQYDINAAETSFALLLNTQCLADPSTLAFDKANSSVNSTNEVYAFKYFNTQSQFEEEASITVNRALTPADIANEINGDVWQQDILVTCNG